MLTTRSFITAGKATFTVHSKVTGAHLTFKVRKPSDETPAFVSVLTGADNETSFTILGTIFADGNYRHNARKSPIGQDATSAKTFAWLWKNIDNLPPSVEFMPACNCCRCGRKLTHPTSIELAIGPECRKHV